MVTDNQVRRLFMLIKKENSLIVAAAKSGMDEEIARKYRNLGKLHSQVKSPTIGEPVKIRLRKCGLKH